MTAAYFEDHPTDPNKMILRKPTMMWEGSLHIVCECDKCKAQLQRTWVGLTDEEVMEIAFNFDVPSLVIRTAEHKLKEKNT